MPSWKDDGAQVSASESPGASTTRSVGSMPRRGAMSFRYARSSPCMGASERRWRRLGAASWPYVGWWAGPTADGGLALRATLGPSLAASCGC